MEYKSNGFKEHSSHDTGLFCRWIPTFQAQLLPHFGFKIRCWEGSDICIHFKLSGLLQETFFPLQILVPNTFCDTQLTSKLYTLVQEAFPTVSISSVLRKHFKDSVGLQQIENLCADEFSSVQIVVSQK